MKKNNQIASILYRYHTLRWRTIAGVLILFSLPDLVFAGGATGAAGTGLSAAATGITGMWSSVQKLAYAVMAVIGIVGAISVYSKWSNGDPDTRKAAGAWFGALIFAGIVFAVLNAVFGTSGSTGP